MISQSSASYLNLLPGLQSVCTGHYLEVPQVLQNQLLHAELIIIPSRPAPLRQLPVLINYFMTTKLLEPEASVVSSLI